MPESSRAPRALLARFLSALVFAALPVLPALAASNLVNISTRMQVLTGNDVLIGGFIVGGTAPKTVVVRARGPSLAAAGIANPLANPRLELFTGQSLITGNDDWQQSTSAAAIQSAGLAPASPLESAILYTLGPGAYTAVVSGVAGATGVGIVEVFEVDRPDVPLTNISTRGQVRTGNDVMIGGFIISGDLPQTVIVRARGPSLAAFGITNPLANPVLQLMSGASVIAANDDWGASPAALEIQDSGFAPGHPAESAMVVTLNPGAYTAIVTGAAGGTGVGIVEVFGLGPRNEAARLLQQATWGASLGEITRAAAIGARAWIDEQIAKPASNYTAQASLNIANNKAGANGCTDTTNGCPWQVTTPTIYKFAFEGQDQLRQRVANALSQIMVVSLNNNRLGDSGTGVPNYLDMLGRHAFGNFRDLLRDVTLHPAMGVYLDMLGSSHEVPNENYARELLQLFSIGTVMLNADGTKPRDAQGNTIPTYDEETVQGFAKAFTGWHFADQNMTQSWKFYWPDERWSVPMKPWTARRCPQDGRWPAGSTTTSCSLNDPNRSFPPPHDTGTKRLLQYAGAPFANLPAGQTPEQDLENAIDNIFRHPNVGPFIGKQLIQRLVTSNPSPGYVQRVSAAFANNGVGIRGDMTAVVRAILLDTEARSLAVAGGNTFGKLREPVAKFLHLHRAFSARASGGYYDIWDLSDPDALGQAPMRAPSVFNFYDRDFAPAGPLGQAGLVGPEFDITTASTVAGFSDFSKWGIYPGFNSGSSDQSRWIRPTYDRYLAGAMADTPAALVDELDLLLTAGNLKAKFKADLVATLNGVTRTVVADQRNDRLRIAIWQIVHSAEYAVQR